MKRTYIPRSGLEARIASTSRQLLSDFDDASPSASGRHARHAHLGGRLAGDSRGARVGPPRERHHEADPPSCSKTGTWFRRRCASDTRCICCARATPPHTRTTALSASEMASGLKMVMGGVSAHPCQLSHARVPASSRSQEFELPRLVGRRAPRGRVDRAQLVSCGPPRTFPAPRPPALPAPGLLGRPEHLRALAHRQRLLACCAYLK